MDGDALLLVGSGVIVLWGVGHLVPTRQIIAGFEPLTTDNRRILTMEWIAEGLTLVFLGALVATVALADDAGGASVRLVARSAAFMLAVLAMLSALTGARTRSLPMRVCPLVKLAVAAMFLIGSA